MIPTVVYDCMIFLQAATNPDGQAGDCLLAVELRRVRLAMSQSARYEAHDVLSRPEIRAKLPRLTDDRVATICDFIDFYAVPIHDVPMLRELRQCSFRLSGS